MFDVFKPRVGPRRGTASGNGSQGREKYLLHDIARNTPRSDAYLVVGEEAWIAVERGSRYGAADGIWATEEEVVVDANSSRCCGPPVRGPNWEELYWNRVGMLCRVVPGSSPVFEADWGSYSVSLSPPSHLPSCFVLRYPFFQHAGRQASSTQGASALFISTLRLPWGLTSTRQSVGSPGTAARWSGP